MFKYISPEFRNTVEQDAEVRAWRGRYDMLCALGKLGGTEVRVTRMLERDKDVPPCRFVRRASHEFVFPPQAETETVDKPSTVDPEPGYLLHREDVTRAYDKAKVRGHIRVEYADGSNRANLHVTDLMDNSQLPDEIAAAVGLLRAAFPTPTTAQ